jgi:hypothetical protein
MKRRVLCIGLLAALACSQQANGENDAAQADQKQATAPIIKPTTTAPKAQPSTKGCPGSHHPEINCGAISANADEDQARNAENQTWWFRWEVGLTFLTLIVASLAMFFAKKAADHTETGATATKQMAVDNLTAITAAVEASNAMREANRIAREEIRPYLLFVGARLEEASESRSHFFRVVVVLKNDGARPAVIKSRECGVEQATGSSVRIIAQDEIGFLKTGDIVGRQSEGAITFRVYKSHIFPWREPGPPGRAETPKMVRFRAIMRVSYRGITDPEEVTYETEIHMNVQLSGVSEIRSEVENYNRREIYR